LDFKTQAEAQTFFNAHKAGDPFGLDTDGDGQACEGLPLSLATAAPRSSLPRTGVSTPVYGFTGLGLLFAGLSLVTLTHRRNTVGRASEYALPRAMAIGGYPAPLPAAVAVQPRSDPPVVLSSEADYALSGWLPHKSQR
jgi:LPXTG-motif cell wall-anchored protein